MKALVTIFALILVILPTSKSSAALHLSEDPIAACIELFEMDIQTQSNWVSRAYTRLGGKINVNKPAVRVQLLADWDASLKAHDGSDDDLGMRLMSILSNFKDPIYGFFKLSPTLQDVHALNKKLLRFQDRPHYVGVGNVHPYYQILKHIFAYLKQTAVTESEIKEIQDFPIIHRIEYEDLRNLYTSEARREYVIHRGKVQALFRIWENEAHILTTILKDEKDFYAQKPTINELIDLNDILLQGNRLTNRLTGSPHPTNHAAYEKIVKGIVDYVARLSLSEDERYMIRTFLHFQGSVGNMNSLKDRLATLVGRD